MFASMSANTSWQDESLDFLTLSVFLVRTAVGSWRCILGLMNLTKPATVEEYVFVMWEGAKRQPLGTFNGSVACLVGKDTVEAVFYAQSRRL
jgi:hypothetical protein